MTHDERVSRLRTVMLITSDGTRWEGEAMSASDFNLTLSENRLIPVKPPGLVGGSGWQVRTSHVVAFRLEDE